MYRIQVFYFWTDESGACILDAFGQLLAGIVGEGIPYKNRDPSTGHDMRVTQEMYIMGCEQAGNRRSSLLNRQYQLSEPKVCSTTDLFFSKTKPWVCCCRKTT